MKRSVWKKLLLTALVMIMAAAVLFAGTNLAVVQDSRVRVHSPEDAAALSADCIVVPGCGVLRSGQPSQMLQDRLDIAIDAYFAGAAGKLLMSGDHGREDYDEVNVMRNYALSRGVPSADIFMDHAGFSTYETMYRAREIFGCKSVIVSTQSYHLYRALYDAKAMGMESFGLNADLRSFVHQRWFNIREVAARAKDFLFCIVKPLPTYLGEAIDIHGSGEVTVDHD